MELENLLFTRYLQRADRSKVLESFDEYKAEEDAENVATAPKSNQRSARRKFSELVRNTRGIRRSSDIPSWRQLTARWREQIYTPSFFRVQQDKVAIAAYESVQTQLDWKRMKTNDDLLLEHLDVSLYHRFQESDLHMGRHRFAVALPSSRIRQDGRRATHP